MNLTNKQLANEFISMHIEKYGLTGNNINLKYDSIYPTYQFPIDTYFTKNNHFKYGYNNQEFNWRENSCSIFWTDYGKLTRDINSFKQEIEIALTEIYEYMGKFSIYNTGSIFSESLLIAAQSLNLPIDIINLEINQSNLEQFESFMFNFCEKVRCTNPLIALYAWAGEQSKFPMIYEGGINRLINHNIIPSHQLNIGQEEMIGPPNWSLIDNEQNTSINRYLISTNQKGIPQFFKWSPELIASQLNDNIFKNWLNYNYNARNNSHIEIKQLRTIFNLLDKNYWISPLTQFDKWYKENSLILANKYQYESQSSIPLYRLIEKLNIDYDFYYTKNIEIYGDVFDND